MTPPHWPFTLRGMMKWHTILPLVLLLWFAAALRIHSLNQQSLWFDEGWSAYAASQPTAIAAAQADLTNPPLYYTALQTFANVAGDSIFVLRWLSVAFGMLAIALAGHIAQQIAPRGGAFFAVLLCAVSTPLVWASQEMRMYTLLALLVLVMAAAWEQLRTRPTRWAWAALLLAELAALYTHNTGPVIAAWINAVTVLAWLFHRRPPPLKWIAGQIAVLVLYLPYFLGRFLSVAGANSALVRRTLPGPDVWGAFWLAPWEMLTANPAFSLYTLPLLALVIVLVPYRSAAARWLAAHVLILTVGLLLALAVLGNELHGRYI
ncbi:MAG: glycosyltransferase family 39 protein, partial [Chloroflexota bacterium]